MRVTEQTPFRGVEAQRLAEQQPSAPSKPAARRLPTAPRERKPALAALAVLLIIGGAMITVTLVLRSGDRVSAVEVVRRVGAGQQMTLQMLKEVQIADDGVRYIPWEQRQQVTDYYAAVDLVPGTLLNAGMLVEKSTELRPGKAVLGLSLKPGQVPPQLLVGDRVQVIYVPGDNSGKPQVLAANARVNWISGVDEAGGGDTRSVEVIVDSGISHIIAAYASSQQIALAYLPGASGNSSTGSGNGGGQPTGEAEPEASAQPTPQTTAKRRATPTATPTRQPEPEGTGDGRASSQPGGEKDGGISSSGGDSSPKNDNIIEGQ
ncbi:hypothetical protein AB0K60_34465 [Thermopolyspora sp. NPDC052614]|uniref:hypothetical protein n=1 Tax=Thermopolyspora sp. NPDC052614 TaxID=3155682 RepID=UPI003445F7F8